jgi:hypothetical protein
MSETNLAGKSKLFTQSRLCKALAPLSYLLLLHIFSILFRNDNDLFKNPFESSNMDLLTVTSLVGNIVQFVDFDGKLLSNAVELYPKKVF